MTGQSLTDDPNLRISLRITQFAEQCKLDIKKRIRPSMFLSVGYEKEVRESSAQLRGATLPNFMSFPLFRKLVLTVSFLAFGYDFGFSCCIVHALVLFVLS